MGGAASQDSYHHGRALQLVLIHARKLRTKTRQPGYLKQESWSAQLAGEQERSQISLPGFGFTRSSISCASVGAADALARRCKSEEACKQAAAESAQRVFLSDRT